MMRVITGTARGRKLATPPGLDTRPTSDLVKEAAFSIIQFEVEGATVLDLFAGSGQMGIEALSRGASHCVLVDSSRGCRAIQKQNLEHTGFSGRARLVTEDAASYLRRCGQLFDIAYVDPPYQKGLTGTLLPLVAAAMRGGAILCETDRDELLPEKIGEFTKKKDYRYGKTKITLYRTGIAADKQ